MLRKYGQVFITLFIASDILLIFFIWVALYFVAGYLSASRIVSPEDFLIQLRIFIIFIPVYLLAAQRFDFYAPRRFTSYQHEFIKTFKVVSAVFIAVFFLGHITRVLQHNRIFILVFWVSSALLIFAYHVVVEQVLKHFRVKGFNLRKILIVGSGELAKQSALKLLKHPEFGLNVMGFITSKKQTSADILGIPVLGAYSQLPKIILEKTPDIVYFALSANEERLLRILIAAIGNFPVDIKIALDIAGVFLLKNSVSEIDGIPIITLRERHFIGFQGVIKRAFDFIFSSFFILLTWPVFVLVAILIKIFSPGPVFYFQERASLDGQSFKLIKFRSMQENAEKNSGPVWTAENDPRRTKLGVWLRVSGLDELPQFINVLKGQMSVVGPRPERPEFLAEFRKRHPHYMFRHALKAGITGLAQVHGFRGNTSLEKRLEYDLDYINHYSFWLDIKIMLMTIPAILKGRGAC